MPTSFLATTLVVAIFLSDKNMLGSLWMIVSSIFFAGYALCLKFASIHGLSSYEILFYRSLFGLVCISSFMLIKGIGFYTPHIIYQGLRSGLGAISIITGAICIAGINIGMAQTLNNTTPLFIGLFVCVGAFLNKKPLPIKLILMIILGFIGVVIMVGPTLEAKEYVFVLIGLVASLTGAIAMSYVTKLARLHEPESRILFYFMLGGTIVGLILTPFVGGFHISVKALTWIFAFSVCSTLGQVFLTMAFSRGNLGLCGFLQYLSIFFSTLLGEIFLDEPIYLTAVIGMIIIVCSGIGASLATREMERKG